MKYFIVKWTKLKKSKNILLHMIIPSDIHEKCEIGFEFYSSSSSHEENFVNSNEAKWQEKNSEFLRTLMPKWLKIYSEQTGPKNMQPENIIELENLEQKSDELTCFSKIFDE